MKTRNTLPGWIWTRPDGLIACGFGTGAAAVAPGTFGTLIGIPAYWFMQPLDTGYYIAVLTALFVFGVWICERVAQALQVHDHPGIVWDEVVGYLVTMMFAPSGWVWWVAGFVLFRVFDIFKPWPIKFFDLRVPGGLGIMIDDVLAGIYAGLCLLLLVSLTQ